MRRGGLYLVDKRGITIDVDNYMRPGDVLLYDGSLRHWVDPIESRLTKAGKGRLQVFAVPTYFQRPLECDRMYADAGVSKFLKVKLRGIKNA